MTKKIYFIFIFSFLTLTYSFAQSKIDYKLLIGKWKFVKFDWPNFVPDTAKIRKESDRAFRSTVYNFTKDKKLLITQENTPKGYSKNLTYTIKNNKIYMFPVGNDKASPQIIEIEFLDKTYLTFYVEGYDPVGTFKRIE